MTIENPLGAPFKNRPKSEIEYPADTEHKIAGSLTAIKQLAEDLEKITALRLQAEAENNLAKVTEYTAQETNIISTISEHKSAIEKLKRT